jgi:hypothetical protein
VTRQLSPLACLLIGIGLLAAAFFIASSARRLRVESLPLGDIYQALDPGEFAGTLMLGGFRGLGADILWLRAVRAKEQGRFYESIALFQTISRIQPRFEQVWEYMAWDLAYNIAVEVQDHDGKWSWFLAGLRANLRGVERNPGSERLLRHLAWMFHHKGDDFHDHIARSSWAAMLNPVLEQVNRRITADQSLSLLPQEPGESNFRISERLYRACVLLSEAEGVRMPAYVRRMIPLAIERDGNIHRNRGEHLTALRRYLDSIEAWQEARAWSFKPTANEDERQDQETTRDSYEQNEGRLRRKAAFLAEQMALDKPVGAAAALAIMTRDWPSARASISDDALWRTALAHGNIQWLDEP